MKINIRENEMAIRKNEDSANFHQQNYENLIKKLEFDLRNHMKVISLLLFISIDFSYREYHFIY